jgi:L-ascorbate metabolism protein UlaG (beta-lactamase superfamily)
MNRRRFLRTTAILGGTAIMGSTRSARANPYYEGPASPHYDGQRFFNPGGAEPGGFGDLMRWQFGGGRSKWPRAWPAEPVFNVPDARVSGDKLRVTMVGHATLLIQVGGLNILTDPVYSLRASPFASVGPRRVSAPGIEFGHLPPIDLVLVTHNHYDHLDVATLGRLHAAHAPLIVTPLGNDRIIRDRKPGLKVHVQDWGDAVQVGSAKIHCEPAHHWSARGLTDRRMALWSAFVIETPVGKIYHIGDTGFHGGINYRAAREKHGGFRLANLPVGAYEPRWFMKYQHQNPEEAVEGMKLCGAEHAAGHHWGTFQLTNEPIEQPRDDLRVALAMAGVDETRFRPLVAGEAWDIP